LHAARGMGAKAAVGWECCRSRRLSCPWRFRTKVDRLRVVTNRLDDRDIAVFAAMFAGRDATASDTGAVLVLMRTMCA